MKALATFAIPIPDEELNRLEQRLRRVVLRDDPFLDELATHLIDAGGKRLRPVLSLASASLLGAPLSEETLLGAVSVELVHLASLYHDDVMDEAERRRNVISVNAKWGNLLAIVAGDFLLARSAELAASLGTEVASLLAATLARLCQGQITEVRDAYRIDRSEADYLGAIANKTAALMATACRIGGITAGLDREQIDLLTSYGESLGMVFQIRDDVFDVIASDNELGKMPAQDLAEGVYTLPVLRALEDPVFGPELRALLGGPLGSTEIIQARLLIGHSHGIVAATDVARKFAKQACEAAAALGPYPIVESLSGYALGLIDELERSTEALAS
ncbi:MAG TPA: polyprenyl synthetase family protein [Acidimicrobiales bacterium]|nr:polyprenyl synthetase family protein [Acidimicrobiales bacterium]